MLKDGIQTGLIRISLVQDSTNEYIPAAGVKFLRSGVKSANFVALPAVNLLSKGTTNNIFDPHYYPLTNHIYAPQHNAPQRIGIPADTSHLRTSQAIQTLT